MAYHGLLLFIVLIYCFEKGHSGLTRANEPLLALTENCTFPHGLLLDEKSDSVSDYKVIKEDSSDTSWISKSQLHKENETESQKSGFESPNSGQLQFLDIPKGDDMRISELHLDEEQLPLETVSNLMSFLEPSQFPMDILLDNYRNHTPIGLLAFKVLKMDIALISWTVVWAVLSVSIPIVLAANLCCTRDLRSRCDDNFSIDSDIRQDKTKRCLKILLHLLAILYLIPTVIIVAANEKMAKSLNKLPESLDVMYGDVHTFIKNTHMQISFAATSSTDIAIEEISKDLEAMNILLGVPYQQVISSDTGIDAVLFNLEDLKMSAAKISTIVADLMIDCRSAKLSGEMLQDQLTEISGQLTVARQQCATKDRALCYTLQYSGYDVTFTLENITKEEKLRDLEKVVSAESFNNTLDIPRTNFGNLPNQMLLQSSTFSSDLKDLLRKKRSEVFSSITSLDQLMRTVSESVKYSQQNTTAGAQKLSEWSLLIWYFKSAVSNVDFTVVRCPMYKQRSIPERSINVSSCPCFRGFGWHYRLGTGYSCSSARGTWTRMGMSAAIRPSSLPSFEWLVRPRRTFL
ncbi:unnamed protein product [Callosobruchus maculatus]|uniref:Prominin-1-A-like n=1 Tax=Callosobruchus maculatus TaxID=64391 RepID=A0A653DT03_CALMS|nr:unnamed protein product [Callosobruchus maculatus]